MTEVERAVSQIIAAQAISSSLDKPIDLKRICIRGRSAGGFNVFVSLSYGRLRTVFVAGTLYAGQETQVTKLELNCGSLCCAHKARDMGIINCFSKLEINHRGWKSGRSIKGGEHAVG